MPRYADDDQGPDLTELLAQLESVSATIRVFRASNGEECACRAMLIAPGERPQTLDGIVHDYWECLSTGEGP